MTSTEQADEVKKLISAFYRLAQLPDWDGPVNERVAEIFGIMLSETMRCSDAFKWIPRPPSGKASISWLAVQLGRGVFERSAGKLSFACARTVALKWKSALYMAAHDIALSRLPTWA